MWKMMKRVVVAVGLCLLIGLQSLGSVQATVNWEACPFCATKVERKTETKLVATLYDDLCNEHNDCLLFHDIYDVFDVVSCQTPGCQMNHETPHQQYTIVPKHVHAGS